MPRKKRDKKKLTKEKLKCNKFKLSWEGFINLNFDLLIELDFFKAAIEQCFSHPTQEKLKIPLDSELVKLMQLKSVFFTEVIYKALFQNQSHHVCSQEKPWIPEVPFLELFNGLPTVSLEIFLEGINQLNAILLKKNAGYFFEVAISYLLRLQPYLTQENIYRFLLLTNLLAIKFLDDKGVKNKTYSRLIGFSNLTEFNKLELMMLKLLKYELMLKPIELLQLLLWENKIDSISRALNRMQEVEGMWILEIELSQFQDNQEAMTKRIFGASPCFFQRKERENRSHHAVEVVLEEMSLGASEATSSSFESDQSRQVSSSSYCF